MGQWVKVRKRLQDPGQKKKKKRTWPSQAAVNRGRKTEQNSVGPQDPSVHRHLKQGGETKGVTGTVERGKKHWVAGSSGGRGTAAQTTVFVWKPQGNRIFCRETDKRSGELLGDYGARREAGSGGERVEMGWRRVPKKESAKRGVGQEVPEDATAVGRQ